MKSKTGYATALLVLTAINIVNFYDRNVVGALVESVRKEFHLTDTQIGLLGSAFIWIYAIIGVPLGRVADFLSRKKLLAGGMVLWGLLTGFAAVAVNYAMLMVSRLGCGVGEAVVAPAATSWIGDLFAHSGRARALAIFMLGVPVGASLSFFFSGLLAQAYGWRVAMAIAAAPAVLLTPALLMLREPKRGASESAIAIPGERAGMWSVLRIPTLWWIIVSGALFNFSLYAFSTFLPAFLSRIHGLSVGRAGMATGIAHLAGGVPGAMLAGAWGDWIIGKRKDGRMLSASVMALGAVPLAYFGIVQRPGSYFLAVALLAVAYGGLTTYFGLVYSSIQEIVTPSQCASTMAIYFMFMYLGGASMGPLLTGSLSDHFARLAARAAGSSVLTESARATGLQHAMLIIPVLSAALSLVLYVGSRTIIRDIARREQAVRAVDAVSA
ncbi:MAG: MFS transporter [Candidatus Acidiferrales bacterium]